MRTSGMWAGRTMASLAAAAESKFAGAENARRLRIRRDLGRWSRKLLLCLGLENIGKHIVGDSKWEKLYDGCPTTTSSSSGGPDAEETPTDFTTHAESTSPPLAGGASPGETAHPPDVDNDSDATPDGGEDERPGFEQSDQPPEVDTPVNSEPGSPAVQPESEQVESEDGECSKDEEPNEDLTRRDIPTPQAEVDATHSRSSTPLHPSTDPADSPPPSVSPADAPNSEEKPGLVDNLFQILPYWYFLNRAFGLPPGEQEPGAHPLADSHHASMETSHAPEADEEEEDEEEEIIPSKRGPPGLPANFSSGDPAHSSAATQRLNSILILESLRQQLQTNEGQRDGSMSHQQSLQHLQLSELLSRMSGGGGELPTLMGDGGEPRRVESVSPHTLHTTELDVDDQPLDLTSTNKTGPEIGRDKRYGGYGQYDKTSPSPFILDEQTSKVFRSNPRSSKGYTAQELQAALHDIQSGKLGTRRAAVIYGIPRSTLRNKVYKLGKDRGRLLANPAANQHNAPHNNNNNGPGSQGVHPHHPHHLNNNNNNNNNNNSKDTLAGKLAYLSADYLRQQQGGQEVFRGRGNSSAIFTRTRSPHSDEEGDERSEGTHLYKQLRHAPPPLYMMGNGDDEHKAGGRSPGKGPPTLLKQSSLSQLISKQSPGRAHHVINSGMGLDDGAELEHGGSVSQLLMGNKDWKYALARHEHLLQQHHQRHGMVQTRGRGGDLSRAGMSSMSSSGTHPHHHLHHTHQHSSGAGSADDSSMSMDLAGKKSRPKRGKYRNYDREALVKAVRAVQNGEMSVHRAGSFFGVPHSTLEYKVKERHLLRRPKRKEVTSPMSQTKSSSPENSMDATSLSRNPTTASHQSAAAYPKGGKPGSNANNNNSSSSSSNSSGQVPGSHPLFPLTSDLRESLSRYLSGETQERQGSTPHAHPLSQSQEEMEMGSASEDEDMPMTNYASKLASSALEGLAGNRLSNLFQLNDILLHRTNSNAMSESRESLLDLSKK